MRRKWVLEHFMISAYMGNTWWFQEAWIKIVTLWKDSQLIRLRMDFGMSWQLTNTLHNSQLVLLSIKLSHSFTNVKSTVFTIKNKLWKWILIFQNKESIYMVGKQEMLLLTRKCSLSKLVILLSILCRQKYKGNPRFLDAIWQWSGINSILSSMEVVMMKWGHLLCVRCIFWI